MPIRAAALLISAVALAAADAADWPQFRGPRRDGISAETGLLRAWPEGGPRLLWESGEVGHGWASVAVVGDRIYTTGLYGDDLHVICLARDGGKRLWHRRLDQATAGGGFKGARPTPTVVGDRLYVLSDAGTLACLAAGDGAVRWSFNVLQKYGAPNARHSLGESLLVDRGRVHVTVGGRASLVAFDADTGKLAWEAKPTYERVAYASPRLAEHGGLRMIVALTGKDIFAVAADDGRLLWTHPRETPHEININGPEIAGDLLTITSGYKVGTEALRIVVDGAGARVERLWNQPALDTYLGGTVLLGDRLIGTCNEQKKGLVALDVRTGNVLWKNSQVGEASLVAADGRLIVQQDDGDVLLVDPDAEGRIVSRFRIPFKKTSTTALWAHPVISGGRLYIRADHVLRVYDIRAAN